MELYIWFPERCLFWVEPYWMICARLLSKEKCPLSIKRILDFGLWRAFPKP